MHSSIHEPLRNIKEQQICIIVINLKSHLGND